MLIALALALATTPLLVAVALGGSQAGRLDQSFGNKGIVTHSDPPLSAAFEVAEDWRGRLVAVGNAGEGLNNYYVARFQQNGRLDRSFGDRGVANYPHQSGPAGAIVIGPRREIMLVGRAGDLRPSSPRGLCLGISQLRAGGGQAVGFGNHNPTQPGRSLVCSNSMGFLGREIARGPGGKFLIGGTLYRSLRRSGGLVARLKPNGLLDHSFGGDRRTATGKPGIVAVMPSGMHEGAIFKVKALRGGKILAGGNLRGQFMAVRLTSDGGLDRSFGRSGIVRIDVDGSKSCECSFGAAMVRDHRGRIIIAGFTKRRNSLYRLVVVRLRRNGSRDRRFGQNGVVHTGFTGLRPTDIAMEHDGRIVISGTGRRAGLVRLNRDGSLDRTFVGDGNFTYDEFHGRAEDVLVDRRGRIVVSGGFELFTLIRLLP